MKKAFTSNKAFMIYSVLIAILLWTFVVYNQNPDSTKPIRGITVYYTNADALSREGLVIIQEKSPTIDITVKGRRLSIAKLDKENVIASLTIPELSPGVYDISADVRLPIGDVSAVDIKPLTTRVIVEKIKTVELPITIDAKGNLIGASTEIKTSTIPEKISLSGPESVINRISSLQVALNLENLGDETQLHQKYRILDQNGEDMTSNPNIQKPIDSVSILTAVYNTKSMSITPDFATSKLPAGYVISKQTLSPGLISIGSIDRSVDSINEIKTAPINLSNITQSTKITSSIIMPPGIINMFDFTSVEVSLTVERLEEKILSITNIDIIGIQDHLDYQQDPHAPVLSVHITGAKSLVDNAIPTAQANVSNLGIGTHVVPVSIKTPEGISVSGEHHITVIITQK